MLQGARWFDLYLKPRGFALQEAIVPREQLLACLPERTPAMLGLLVDNHSKHAVVFVGKSGDTYRFINNRHPSSDEPDELLLTSTRLLMRTDPQVHLATLVRVKPVPLDRKPTLAASLDTLADYRRDMEALRHTPCDRARLKSLMNTHFRAFLLDALTMMRLIHEDTLADRLTRLQSTLLQAVRTGMEGVLDELLPMDDFMHALADYEALIAEKVRSI